MVTLTDYLNQRITQLKHRKMMIPRYIKLPGNFVGKKDFSLDDIPNIEKEIKECETALAAIKKLNHGS